MALCSVFAGNTHAQMSTNEDRIFSFQVVAGSVYEDCGPFVADCEDTIGVIIHRVGVQLKPPVGFPDTLGLLPTPLLSSVLTGLRLFPDRCSVKDLGDELDYWSEESARLGSDTSARSPAAATAACFNGGSDGDGGSRSIVFLWQAGEIVAWLVCQGSGCVFQFYPPESTFGERTFPRFGVSVSAISRHHADQYVFYAGSVLGRILSFAPGEIQREYNEIALEDPATST